VAAPPGAREVRKTVTTLFCDVVHSTALGESADPESVRRIMTRYFDEMQAIVERHGGTVEKFIGDEVMAVFGVPAVHEDDALRAVRAGAEMRSRVDELNEELAAGWGVRLAVRIGINTGQVIAGDPATRQTFVTGDAVNVAKRLQQAAEPGEILIGKATYPLVRDAVKAGPLASFSVKGRRETVAPWRLDEVDASAPGLARRLDAPLVGRAAELAALHDAFDEAVRGRATHLVTVVGAPGVGKSRLASELLASVAQRGTALVGRCLSYGDGITFWPLAEIVRGAGGESAVAAALAGSDDAELVAGRIRGIVGAAPPGSGAQESFWAVRRFFEALARKRPLVVCFEDIHWAEPTLLDLIEYLVGLSRDAPILLLCLARPELLDARPGWTALAPRAQLLTVEPLGDAESEALLDALGEGARLPGDVRTRIAQAAEGNPLFVEQMVAMVAEGGAAAELAVPPSIQALLGERLDRLEPAERAVIERAAVIGREFWGRAVVDLLEPDHRGAALSHLLALVRKGLIRPDHSSFAGEDAFRFRHVLIRDAAYEGVPKTLRADLHERVAAWLERHAGERAAELEEIGGYHLEQAFRYREQLGPVDDDSRALAVRAGTLLGSAGRRAYARDDMPAAINLLDRAVSLVTEKDPARLELVRELGGALYAVGELARAEALLDGLAAAAAAAGDRRLEWYALLDRGGWRAAGRADDLLAVANEALPVFEELGDELGLARVFRRIATGRRMLGQLSASAQAAERAIGHARRAGSAQEESRSVDVLCISLLYGPVSAPRAVTRCRELLAAARGNPLGEAAVLSSLAGLRAMQGEFEEARRCAARARAIYDERDLRLPIAGLTQITGPLELLAGDAEAAERELRLGYGLLVGAGARGFVGFQAALLADALLARGRVDEAAGFVRTSDEAPNYDVFTLTTRHLIRARFETASGRPDAAVAAGREAEAAATRTDAPNLRGDALMALAQALAVAGRADEAARAADAARALYERKGNVVAARGGQMLPPRAPAR
jgi:class 3 adenylate cyclase/tetratricopeptide (TPR) repeat protein